MAEHEARGRAFYDHDEEEPRTPARRRRPAADWGVGEEIFDHMPRRRFGRDEPHDIPRGGADDGRRTVRIADAPLPPVKRQEVPEEEFASRDEALRAREEHDAVWGGDEPFAGGSAPVAEPPDEPAPEPQAEAEPVADRRVAGRRTVKIGGRPGEFAPTERRRPSRTAAERVAHRPARFAAWAFALGLLLILVAVATAVAGV
jgi:hypothetical protein